MTQEEKLLLVKDLSARLPYGVIVHTWYNKPMNIECTGVDIYTNTIKLDLPEDDDAIVYIDNVKPYLRPMSSMTEEEKEKYQYITERWMYDANYSIADSIDWLNSHYFDYHDLIGKGLAIEVTEENNPYNK